MRFSPGSDSDKEFEKVIYEEEKRHWRTTKVYQPKRSDRDKYRDYDDRDMLDDWDEYDR
jgi:hypothetical protein